MAETPAGITPRRTKRRYAHELYPEAHAPGSHPLAVEVPYLYARALGFEVHGTGWIDTDPDTRVARINQLIASRELAFLADALLQDLIGEEAWEWAQTQAEEESGELVWERAEHYGVPVYDLKPFPCGAEPHFHYHFEEPDTRGIRIGNHVAGNESECPDCTEPVAEETSDG